MSKIGALIPLSAIQKSTKFRSVEVRVLHLWNQKEKFGKVSLEAILMDKEANKIQASVPPNLVGRFKSQFQTGQVVKISNFVVTENATVIKAKLKHDWKINFAMSTLIVEVKDQPAFPLNGFSFIPFDEFKPNTENQYAPPANIDPTFTFDVIGVVVTPLKDVEYVEAASARKLEVTIYDGSSSLVCVLWESYADELKSYFNTKGGESNEHVVLILQFASLSSFKSVHRAQSQKNASRLHINLDCEEVKDFMIRFESGVPVSALSLTTEVTTSNPDKWLKPNMIKTIPELTACEQSGIYITYGILYDVDQNNDWYYKACGNKDCTKGFPKYGKLNQTCLKCKKPIEAIVPRYKLKMHVVDEFDNYAFFIMFDKIVASLLNKSAKQVMEDNNIELGAKNIQLPAEFGLLGCRQFLFRVELDENHVLEKADKREFTVKEVTEDPNIIDQWKQLSSSEEVGSQLKLIEDIVTPAPSKSLVSNVESVDDSSSPSATCEVTPNKRSTEIDIPAPVVDVEGFQFSATKKIKIEK